MKKWQKRIINILSFIIIVNIPFAVMVQCIGFDTFVDSFENPDSYIYLPEGRYLIQKPTHPDFSIGQEDKVLYCDNENGKLFCQTYAVTESNNKSHVQVIGKVVSILDENNTLIKLSMNIWDFSIHKLNIKSLVNKYESREEVNQSSSYERQSFNRTGL